MPVDDPHNLNDQLQSQKEKLDSLTNEDARMLWDFTSAANKEMAASTVIQYLSKLRAISEKSDAPIEELTPRQMDSVLDDLEEERGWSSKGTRRNYEKALRVLCRELRNARVEEFGRDYSSVLPARGAIRLSDKDETKITPEDILTREQIETLIQDCCRTARDRAIVAMLADTGLRIAQMLSLRVKDVDFRENSGGGFFQANPDATGLKGDDKRKPLTWSAAHIESYLFDEHPRPNADEAPLFHKSEGWSKGEDDDGSMTPALVRQRLERLVRDDDTDLDPEDVHPHVFRHTAVTVWARQGFTDREIKHRAGWSRDSDMLDRYEHIQEDEINKQVLQRYGFDIDEDGIGEPELDRCPRCSAALTPEANYCPRCSARVQIPEDTLMDLLMQIAKGTSGPAIDEIGRSGQSAEDAIRSGDIKEEGVRTLLDVKAETHGFGEWTEWHEQRLQERFGIDIEDYRGRGGQPRR
ncbi:site-specific integrase [Halomicroarcula sp. S1AR25-4]|uniref:site-specific integrase n=1 Tax=Haloarcula sp. S1AR25-4 TaxID=2950538 RepID=UPI002874ACEB|nr:site-specific integrase [Halomicroarcula sp. S1AR25-4]MDS0277353.1 site-specific integrase [Halomicroarcula sp. S1AR25-4]